jgi:hypothetical protein
MPVATAVEPSIVHSQIALCPVPLPSIRAAAYTGGG